VKVVEEAFFLAFMGCLILARKNSENQLWPEITVYILDNNNLATLFVVLEHLIPTWLFWAEIECTVRFALPKWPIDKFKPVQQIRQQVLIAYCPNINTYSKLLEAPVIKKQDWNLHCAHSRVGFHIKIGRPKFYAGEMITPASELGTIVIVAWPSFLVSGPPWYCNRYLLC
jgi:hypothetical protein